MGEYSKEYAKVNKRIKNDPKVNANIEKLQQQWSMYLELGVQMVVFGAWVDMDRKEKWSLYIASEICSLGFDHSTDLKAMRVLERTSQIS